MSQSIELGEGQKSAQFLIENDSNEKMAIELTVTERIMNEEGKEELPETKELSIFPPQIIIPPKDKRTIRLNWSGKGELKTERAFRVIAEQLPLKVDNKKKKKSGIQMLMKYMAALYVTPEDAKSNLKIESIKTQNGMLDLVIINDGNKHQVLIDPVLTITDLKKTYTLKSSELKGVTGENILALAKRKFSFKSDLSLSDKALATIKVND